MVKKVHLDFETRSRVDLKLAGTTKYAQDPSTSIMCLTYAVDDAEPVLMEEYFSDLEWGRAQDTELFQLAADPDVIFVAHNAFFEQCVWQYILVKRFNWPPIELHRWRCTMAKAAALGLPQGLGDANKALGLNVEKDLEGRRLMLKYTKPRKTTKNNVNEFHNDPTEFKLIFEYNIKDVIAERALDEYLPDLSPSEQEVWFLDQTINHRGVPVDSYAIDLALDFIQIHRSKLEKRLIELTKGHITKATQGKKIIDFLEANGVTLPNITKATVYEALESGLYPDWVNELLVIRQELSQTSTAKIIKMQQKCCNDGRIRENLAYCAAGTGRWGGRGVQFQNLPRGEYNSDTVVSILLLGDYDFFYSFYPDVFKALSSAIRGLISVV